MEQNMSSTFSKLQITAKRKFINYIIIVCVMILIVTFMEQKAQET